MCIFHELSKSNELTILTYNVVIKVLQVLCTVDELTTCCLFLQPDTTDPNGVTHTWHIPITAHVVISLSLATRLTGVRTFVFTALKVIQKLP